MNLGFEDLFTANSNLDLLALGFGLLGKVNVQHALVVVGAHLPEIHELGSVNDRVNSSYCLRLRCGLTSFVLRFSSGGKPECTTVQRVIRLTQKVPR